MISNRILQVLHDSALFPPERLDLVTTLRQRGHFTSNMFISVIPFIDTDIRKTGGAVGFPVSRQLPGAVLYPGVGLHGAVLAFGLSGAVSRRGSACHCGACFSRSAPGAFVFYCFDRECHGFLLSVILFCVFLLQLLALGIQLLKSVKSFTFGVFKMLTH